MSAYRSSGSKRGEHLVAMLVVAIVVLGMLTAYPAVASGTKGTAERAQQRVDRPLAMAAELDGPAAASYAP